MEEKNYSEIHQSQLNQMDESIRKSSIYELIKVKEINSRKLQHVLDCMSRVLGRNVIKHFHFPRCGAITGILQTIVQTPKLADQLLACSGISRATVDLWGQFGGILPFARKTTRVIDYGNNIDVTIAREIVKVAAREMGVVVTDNDVADITSERWANAVVNAIAISKATIEAADEASEVEETVMEE